jgi:Reverse transcriptase (RNA-dependent DNA polymerase).
MSKYITIIVGYTDNVAYVKTESSEPNEGYKRLRQGCSLSFNLLDIYLEKTLDHWKKSYQGMGFPIKENKCLFSLKYADDQVKIFQGADDLKFILRIWY